MPGRFTGGVGTIAIQLAKSVGAHVATTTSATNVALVESLGADVVVDYHKLRFEKVLSDYDVVLNTLGPDVLNNSIKVLKKGGLLISISGPPDPATASQLGLSAFVRLVFSLLSWSIRRKAAHHGVRYKFLFMEANGGELNEISTLIESGKLRPVIDRVFPFEATPDAFTYLETNRAKGKIVVTLP